MDDIEKAKRGIAMMPPGPERKRAERILGEAVALSDMSNWMLNGFRERPRFERNDVSRLHIFLGALKAGNVVSHETLSIDDAMPFVIQHDWASAFAGAGDYEGMEYRLPFDHCAFELRYSNKSIIVFARQAEGAPPQFSPFLSAGAWWCRVHPDTEPMKPILEQIKAVSVALESGAAVADLQAAPERLNKKRAEKGDEPIREYRIVRLARSHRGGQATGKGSGKRLHFRRGHWRHYEDHRTWIKWMLVGDPELGFIDQEYRL